MPVSSTYSRQFLQKPYTTTSANFVLPAGNGSEVAISVADATVLGKWIFVESGSNAAYLRITSKPSITQITAANDGTAGNAAPSTTFNAGAIIYNSARPGDTGSQGPQGIQGLPGSVEAASSLVFNAAIAPPSTGSSERKLFINSSDSNNPALREPSDGTTKRLLAIAPTGLAEGDLLYYNGTNFVRLAIGNNGQVLSSNGTIVVWANPSGRERLTGDRIYYVRSDGNNSNNGLADSAGGAFLTLEKADEVVAALDRATFTVNIQVGTGTFTGIFLKEGVGSGKIVIKGNGTANTIITQSSGGSANDPRGVIEAIGIRTKYSIEDLKLTCTGGTYSAAICSAYGSLIEVSNVNFGSCTSQSHLQAADNGEIFVTGNYSLSGAASIRHYWANGDGIIRCQGRTINITSNLAFTTFALSDYGGKLFANGNTYPLNSNTVTGQRYYASQAGQIVTVGGANYFPGNSAGAVESATYGLYI